jgi:two-component system, LytTR family, sensor kinase
MTQSNELLSKIVNRKVLLHCTFWITLLFIVFLSENWEHRLNFKMSFFLQYILAFLIFIFISYFNIYFLIPRFFRQKKYFFYVTWLVFVILFGAVLTLMIKLIFDNLGVINPHDESDHERFLLFYYFHVVFGELMLLVMTTFFFILEEWIRLQGITIKMQEIESQKVQSELQALKAQINPHFLFNTLNNIYSHSLEKSAKTPDMILKLSELMSYILYECHDEQVPVKNELNFIRNFIELEKIRFEDNLQVKFDIEEKGTNQVIVPLLFIPIIENAFKHVGNIGKEKPYVNVFIAIDSEQIVLKVNNSVSKDATKKTIKESGIGLENVRKRLDLLYPGKYNLEVIEDEKEYLVNLVISNQ